MKNILNVYLLLQHLFLSNLDTHTSFLHEIYNDNMRANITAVKLAYEIETDNPVGKFVPLLNLKLLKNQPNFLF